MTKAFLQNKKAKYYLISAKGEIELTEIKTPLSEVPEEMASIEELNFAHRTHYNSKQSGFIFRHDGMKILLNILVKEGIEGDCVLTLEGDQTICGDLDFSTFLHEVGKGFKICCINF